MANSRYNNFNIIPPPAQLSKEEFDLVEAESDLISWSRLFLKQDFRKTENPPFHYEIGLAYLNDTNRKDLACIVARGHAKTTLTKAHNLYRLVTRKKDEPPHFIGWVADTKAKAMRNLHYVAQNLEFNKRIIRYYGKRGSKSLSRTWTKEEIETIYGDVLVCRSNIISLRGEAISTMLGGTQRYTIIILDDVESKDNTKTFESRKDIKDKITTEVRPALDLNRGRLIFNGTPVHPDSFCQNIIDNYRKAVDEGRADEFHWIVFVYPATQPTMPGGVLWQAHMSKEKLEKERQFFIDTTGSDAGYYQEYELIPQGKKDRIWTSDHYQIHQAAYFWDPHHNHSFLNWGGRIFPVNCFLGSDPATDIETRDTDYSVIMVIAVDAFFRIFVMEYVAEQSIPEAALRNPQTMEIIGKEGVVEHIIRLYDRYHCLTGTLE